MNTVIEFRDVCKAYGDHVVLDHLSLGIERGAFVTIVGASGGGKTTALKMVNGLVSPDSGQVLVDGQSVAEKNLVELRRSIGYAIQGSVLFPHMTVAENIAYVPNLLNKKDKARTKAAVAKWLAIVGLDEELLQRYPAELSGGQQQRVGIARAFVSHPPIVFADEPTGNLDSKTSREVMSIMVGMARRYHETLVVVTHDREIARFGDRLIEIHDGLVRYDSRLAPKPAEGAALEEERKAQA